MNITDSNLVTVTAQPKAGQRVIQIAPRKWIPVGLGGKEPSGGGEVDVTSTTAEAGDVLSSKIFFTSGGVMTTGTIPTVSASLLANVTTVPSGYIASAQELTVPEASSATVSGGIITIPQGYVSAAYPVSDTNLVASNIASGVSIFGVLGTYEGSGGSSSAENVSSGFQADGDINVSSGWEYQDTRLIYAQSIYISNGGMAVDTAVGNNCTMVISSGGSAVRTLKLNGGEIHIQNGGFAEDTFISGGSMYVSSGGNASHTRIDGGDVIVSGGGTANHVLVNIGGRMFYYNQAAGANILINSGGSAVIEGVVSNVTVSSGGMADIWGTADTVHICSGGLLYSRGTANITNLVVDPGGEVQ